MFHYGFQCMYLWLQRPKNAKSMNIGQPFMDLILSMANNSDLLYGNKEYLQPGVDVWDEFNDYCDNLSRGVVNHGIAEYYFGTIDMLKNNRDFV